MQKRRSKLDIFHKKSEAMQQISKKVLLDAQEKKRKRRKNPNRFNYHNRVATYYVMLLRRIIFILYWKGLFYWKQKGGKKIQASFMIEANSYKKVIGCIQCSWRFLMASLLNGSLTLLVSTWLHKYLLSSMYRKVENVQRQNWLCT